MHKKEYVITIEHNGEEDAVMKRDIAYKMFQLLHKKEFLKEISKHSFEVKEIK